MRIRRRTRWRAAALASALVLCACLPALYARALLSPPFLTLAPLPDDALPLEPAGTRLRHALVAAAAGMPASDAHRLMASLAQNAPGAVLVLAVSAGDVVGYRAAIATPNNTHESGRRLPGGRVCAFVRLYDADELSRRVPAHARNYTASTQRYYWYAAMLDDLDAADGEGAARRPDDPQLVLFSNAERRAPHAVLLSDAREVVVQRDPFALMWTRYYGATLVDGARVATAGVTHVRQRPLLLAAQESVDATVNTEDFNRDWVRDCYGDAGLRLVCAEHILCSGSTLGTTRAVRAYVRAMIAGEDACAALRLPTASTYGGLDQGVHNVLLRVRSAAAWAALPAAAPDGPAPELAALARDFHAAVDVAIAPAEGDHLCTVGRLAALGAAMPRDADGYFTALNGTAASPRCAVVHQYDRAAELDAFYGAVFGPLP